MTTYQQALAGIPPSGSGGCHPDKSTQFETFFKQFWPDDIDGWLAIWIKYTDGGSQSFFFSSIAQAVEWCRNFNGLADVYFGVCVLKGKPSSGRGKKENIKVIPGYWTDIDVAGPGHTEKEIFPTEKAAREFLKKLPFQPSVVVMTHGGLHVYWLFCEPLVVGEDGTLEEIQRRVQHFQAALKARTNHRIDSTHDLSRVLRIPGFKSRKYDKVVTLEEFSDRRYSPDELDDWADEVLGADTMPEAATGPGLPPAELEAELSRIPPDQSYQEWIEIGMALHAESGGSEWGLKLWDQWSAKDPERYKGLSDLTTHWKTFDIKKDRPLTWGSIRRRYEIETWPDPIPLGTAHPETAKLDLKHLPKDLGLAAEEVARFVKVPAQSPALVALAVLAVAIGKRAVVVERVGLEHHPSLFFALIAGSGERKSPVFDIMTRPLEQWEHDQEPTYQEELRRVKARNLVTEKAIKKITSKIQSDNKTLEAASDEIARLESGRLPAPVPPKIFTTDTTEERLFNLLHSHGGAYGVLSGEGRCVVDAILGKYSNSRTGEGIYLAGISGDRITRDRVGGEFGPVDLVIYKPCLNVCVFIQPDKFLELSTHPAMRESGAVARILTAWLPSMVGSRIEEANETPLNLFALKPYFQTVRQILEVPNREQPHRAGLSPETAETRRLFHNELERKMADGGELEDVRDIASKATTHVCKVALLLHLADHPELLVQDRSEISLATWKSAQAIVVSLMQSAIETQRMGKKDRLEIRAGKILSWWHHRGKKSITAREIAQSGPRPRLKTAEIEEVMTLLSDFGYCRKNGKEYILNPKCIPPNGYGYSGYNGYKNHEHQAEVANNHNDHASVARLATVAVATPESEKTLSLSGDNIDKAPDSVTLMTHGVYENQKKTVDVHESEFETF